MSLDSIIILLVFITGTCTGSFLNLCIYRVPAGETVVTGRSRCRSCGHHLNFYEMIPVASYFLLRGNCRHCGRSISPRYPLVESATGLLFVLAYLVHGCTWATIAAWFFISLLVVAAFIDLDNYIIPDGLVLAGLTGGILFALLQSVAFLINGLYGLLIAGIVMLAIAFVSRGGMGGGDIKLSAVMGLYLGWQKVLVALLVSFVFGGVVGVLLLATGRKGRKDKMPFGPFLALGGIVAVLWGEKLLAWYKTLTSIGG